MRFDKIQDGGQTKIAITSQPVCRSTGCLVLFPALDFYHMGHTRTTVARNPCVSWAFLFSQMSMARPGYYAKLQRFFLNCKHLVSRMPTFVSSVIICSDIPRVCTWPHLTSMNTREWNITVYSGCVRSCAAVGLYLS